MTFHKPPNMKYTDMCIYVDNNVYNENVDESKIYEYIYHIYYMLAQQQSFFKEYKYYDTYALYCANIIFMRYKSKKQFEFNEDGTPKLKKIKSLLNYAKKTAYQLKIKFEQSEYSQQISKECYTEEVNYNFDNLISKTISGLHLSDFKFLMNDIDKTTDKFLSTIPYLKTSKEWINIKISVLLTFLSYITVTKKVKDKLNHLKQMDHLNDEHLYSSYEQEGNKEAILFHLPESMSPYITVLTRELKNIIAKDLSDILHTKFTYDAISIENSVKEYWQDMSEPLNEN